MVIRKYVGATEEEATKLAKEELGEDVVIMNVKQTGGSGLMRFFRKPSVEVTAAVDDVKSDSELPLSLQRQPEKKEEIPDFSKLQEAIKETNAVLAAEEEKKAERQAEREKASVKNERASKILQPELSELVAEDEAKEKNKKEEKDDIGERLSNLQELLEKQMQATKEKEEEKKDEDDTGKQYFDLIRKKLEDNEVEETYISQILDDIEGSLGKNATLDAILAGVYQKIVLKIGEPHLIEVQTKKTKYIFFIGPTGVGKTTTIAKIAATLKLTKKTKLALVTSDTYRIAAVEQLRTYANILGIPLQVVYTPEDMKQATEELRDYDLVFVDTAGRSHNNDEQREDISKLFDAVSENQREVYLVLSATTKYKDLVRIATTYAEMTKYNLIFTKLDETDTIGNIFNIRMLTGAPISYSTHGQNVPDDIGKTNAQNIAKQLLGGNG